MENKITLLWRSNKSPEIMCADYLSRFMANARHENITIKFSNKLPKLKEEELWATELQIPEQYKINDTPVTYKELINIFKKTALPSHYANAGSSVKLTKRNKMIDYTQKRMRQCNQNLRK